MAAVEPITPGARFGRWTVVQEAESKVYSAKALRRDMYLCICDCGATRPVCGRSLITSASTSCGCSREAAKRAAYTAAGMKRCNRCKRDLPLTAFGKRPDRGPTAVRPKCIECGNEVRQIARNAESPGERRRALDLATKWKCDDKAWKAWRVAEAQREIRREYLRDYYRRNPGKGPAKTKQYQTKRIRAIPLWADPVLIAKVYARCAKRRRLRTRGVGDWTVDHIVPLQSKLVCGLHVQDNLQLLSNSANVSKGNRHWPDMWPDMP